MQIGRVMANRRINTSMKSKETTLTARTPSSTKASVRPPECLPLPVPLASASLVGAHSLLTRQPNSSGPSWSPGMSTIRKRMSGWKVLRLRWMSYTVTPSHRYSSGGISLVTSCERATVTSLPFALPAHHEPLAATEFVKGGAHCGDPALIAQVEFQAYDVT